MADKAFKFVGTKCDNFQFNEQAGATCWQQFLAKEIFTARYRLHNATHNSQEFSKTIE